MKKYNKIKDDNFLSSSVAKKQSRLIPFLLITSLILVILGFSTFFTVKFIKKYLNTSVSVTALIKSWQEYDYEKVYDISRQILETKPFNNTALTYHGYASFYLAVSQIDTSLSQSFLDEAINNIRLALYNSGKQLTSQLQYMLGKAYFYKNTITSYYYADLAIKYLTLAKENGYKADDIPEYMGLSYAALGKPMESISSFTEALLIRESDSLLLSIAEQYYKVGQTAAAKQYLYRIKKDSNDDSLVLKSMNLLAMIYIDEKNYTEAKNEINFVLEKSPSSADAFYVMGLIYEKQGDLIKARSEWRKALKLQVNHPGALSKLAQYGK